MQSFSPCEVGPEQDAVFAPEPSAHECADQKNIKRPGSSLEASHPSSSTDSNKKAKRTQDHTELLLEVVQNGK